MKKLMLMLILISTDESAQLFAAYFYLEEVRKKEWERQTERERGEDENQMIELKDKQSRTKDIIKDKVDRPKDRQTKVKDQKSEIEG